MPTYTVTNSNFKINVKQKNEIAKGITKIHNKVTGANTYFAQVIFNKTKNSDHFMGGRKVKEPQIFLYGQIRAGRTNKVKNKLIITLRDAIIKNSDIKKDCVWVYLLELTPAQMIEYGEVLPQSGKEAEWFNSLPNSLQKKLKKIDE